MLLALARPGTRRSISFPERLSVHTVRPERSGGSSAARIAGSTPHWRYISIAREAADLSQGRAGQLRIGAGPEISVRLLPAACVAILKEAPGAELTITVGALDQGAPAVSAGELDLGVFPSRPTGYDDLARERLFDEAFVVLVSARHRLARKKRVTVADVGQERWILGEDARGEVQLLLCHAFAQSGLPPPTVSVTTYSTQFKLQLLRWSDLLGFGPRRFVRDRTPGPRLVELPVEGLSGRLRYGAYYRKGAYLSPIALRFIEILKSVAKEIARER